MAKKQAKSKSKAVRPAKTYDEMAACWLAYVQTVITRNSTAPRKSGKYKGHCSTDVEGWVAELTSAMKKHLRINAHCAFDENLAIAFSVGSVLLQWWVHTSMAKAMDPNRPLDLRKSAIEDRANKLAWFFKHLNDLQLMGHMHGANQNWNFPYGKDAKGGEYR